MATRRLGFVTAGIAALTVLLVGGAQQQVSAQSPVPTRLTGIINDYLESGGAWHISGEWSVQPKAGGKADFIASLNMLRSDLWVLLTGADPTNPTLRGVHTHHVGLIDGTVTVIANGWRISGNAIITSNGSVAGFSGSAADVEITGGGVLPSSNLKLTFTGAATGHFGTQPLDGVVIFGR